MVLFTSLFLGITLLFLSANARSAMPEAKHVVVDIVSINGEEFTVQGEDGKEAKIHVGSDTQMFGRFQPGDRIEAWVFPNGHAKTVMILRHGSAVQTEREQHRQSESAPRAEIPQGESTDSRK